MDRETTSMCCLKDPQSSVAPKCQSILQVRLHSPVLQHRGDGQGSSSFLKLPWGRCEWGEGRRPAGPGSCGAALGTPEGTALPWAHLRAQPLATALPTCSRESSSAMPGPAGGCHGHSAWLCVCVSSCPAGMELAWPGWSCSPSPALAAPETAPGADPKCQWPQGHQWPPQGTSTRSESSSCRAWQGTGQRRGQGSVRPK